MLPEGDCIGRDRHFSYDADRWQNGEGRWQERQLVVFEWENEGLSVFQAGREGLWQKKGRCLAKSIFLKK